MWKLMENIIEKDDIDSLTSFLNTSDRFTNGPKVKEFEEQWSQWLNVNHSVMVNSGASGNFLTNFRRESRFFEGRAKPRNEGCGHSSRTRLQCYNS